MIGATLAFTLIIQGYIADARPFVPLDRHQLDEIADRCNVPRTWLRIARNGELRLIPPKNARYQDVDCVLAALPRNGPPLGFVGNELVAPEASDVRQDSAHVSLVRTLEQQIEDAISRRDHDFLDRVTAPTFTRTNPEGRVEDRAAVMALIRQPPPTSDIIRRTIDPAAQQVQLHGDVAITRGELEVRGPRRAYRRTYLNVYRWRHSMWQLISSTTLSVTPLAP